MSTFKRLASGNIAGLTSMVFNIFAQVALVPVFLHFWDAERYGVWIAMLTAMTVLGLFDAGHVDYVGFEAMKVPVEDRARRGQIYSDALPVLAMTGFAQLTLLAVILQGHAATHLFGPAEGSPMLHALRLAIFGLMLLWVAVQVPISLFGRVLSSVGHFAAATWWQMGMVIGQTICSATAVVLGAGLGVAALAYGIGTLAAFMLSLTHFRAIARREGIALRRPQFRAGLRRWRSSILLGIAALLEFMQQAGFRLILLPLVGAAGFVQFSTMRTVANLAQTGLVVLTNPAVPELMRFVSARDSFRTSVLMTGTLYVTVMLICPAFVLLQAIAPPLYHIWTLGKISFHGLTFALLSAAVLVFCLSQPSRAIVRGNNLVRAQTTVSFLAAGTAGIAGYFGLRAFGVPGAAGALVLAELVRSGLNILLSIRWFERIGFAFPAAPMGMAAGSVGATILVILAMALWPPVALYLLVGYLPLWIAMNALFWWSVPVEGRAVVGRALAGSWQKLRRRPSLG